MGQGLKITAVLLLPMTLGIGLSREINLNLTSKARTPTIEVVRFYVSVVVFEH